MRHVVVIVLATALSGCSFLDQLQLNGPQRLDPSKVYLNRADVVYVGPRETQRFACAGGPLVCSLRGVEFECSCP